MRIRQFITEETIERLVDALVLVGPEGAILDANTAALGTYSYSLDEMRALNFGDLEAALDDDRSVERLQTAAEHGAPLVTAHRRSDGSLFPVEIRIAEVDADGSRALLASLVDLSGRTSKPAPVLTDVAGRAPTDTAIRESEAKYRMITEDGSEVIWTMDPETRRFLYVSPSVYQLRGFTPEEVMAEPIDAALTPEGAQAVGQAIAEGFEAYQSGREPSGHSYVNEVEQPCKDGSMVWTEVVTSFHLNELTGRLEVHGVSRDISERRRVEQTLGAYEELLEASPTSITVHTPQGEFIYANQRALESHGYDRDEFLALTLGDIDVPEDASRIAERVRQIEEHGEANFEVHHRRKDGSTFPMVVSARVAVWDGREVILSAATDITDRTRAEELLRESRDMLVNLTERVPGVVYQYRLNPDGSSCFPWSSPGMDEIYEVTPEEVREDATPVFGRLHPDDADRVSAAIMESARTLGPCRVEYRVVLPRQGLRWRWSDAVAQRTEDGGTLWHGIITDITDRKEAARALVESAERHRTILETAMDGYWLVDMEGRLVEVNAAYAEMSGYSEEELIRMSISDLEAAEAPKDIAGRVRKIVERGEDRFESQHRRKDGSIFDVEVSVRYQPTSEGRLAAFLRDITESKLAAERLARSLASIIEVVGQVVETRDPYTAGHERRVAQLAMSIAREMGMPSRQVEAIRVSALIHDVGKISVPAEILSKPGRLSEIEFELIKCHAESGYNILAAADMDETITEMVHQHHERCDGTGYPRGLSETAIVDGAKVLMVADVVEAMVSHRPYRAGLGVDAALAEIERGAGVQYDCDVVGACLVCFRERGFAFSDA